MDFAGAAAYLDACANRGVKKGLERMEFLCALLDDPQSKAPAFHITGTNGKGSTARMLTALVGAGGLSTGTYTSPHLQLETERVALDGQPIDTDLFAHLMDELVPYFELMERDRDEGPTYFEVLTMLAFAAFADRGVDVQIVEVGLGGIWDATNVIDGRVAVLTNVDVDHTNYFGSDPRGIAREKAGIIKAESAVVTGVDDPTLLAILSERAVAVGAESFWRIGEHFGVESYAPAVGGQMLDLRTPAGIYRDVFLPLFGRHQADNAAVALAAFEAFHGGAVSEGLVREAFAAVRNPARIEVVGHDPLIVLDVAHNPHGVRALARALPETFTYSDRYVVVGILDDKDRAGMIPLLARGSHVIATAVDYERSVSPEVIAKEAQDAGAASAVAVEPVRAAVDRARDGAGFADLVLITGSHYTVGEARRYLVGPGPAI